MPVLLAAVTPERLARMLLAAVLLWHLTFWVLMPATVYTMLPLDTLELLGWGQEWQWGYYKHPPLGAWLGEAWFVAWREAPASLYLLAQLAVLATFAYVWYSARLFLDPVRAALAVVLLEGSYFHTVLTPNFNMNSLQLPVWAGLGFHFLRAWQGASRHWLGVGLFAALALLTKYSGLLLLASLTLLLVATRRGRAAFSEPMTWAGLAVALLLSLPHLLWLAEHWQLPLAYLRSYDDTVRLPGLHGHLLEPLRFAIGAGLSLLPALLLFALLVAPREPRLQIPPGMTPPLLALCLGPLLLSLLYGAVTGSRLKTTWAYSFFSLAGVALFALVPTSVDMRRLRRFAIGLGMVVALTATAHVLYKTRSERPKTRFDGPALARTVAAAWEARYGGTVPIVVADHILAAIVSTYAPGRPSMLVRGDFAISPWVDRARLAQEGAVVLCRVEQPCFPAFAAQGTGATEFEVSRQRFRMYFLPPADRSGH